MALSPRFSYAQNQKSGPSRKSGRYGMCNDGMDLVLPSAKCMSCSNSESMRQKWQKELRAKRCLIFMQDNGYPLAIAHGVVVSSSWHPFLAGYYVVSKWQSLYYTVSLSLIRYHLTYCYSTSGSVPEKIHVHRESFTINRAAWAMCSLPATQQPRKTRRTSHLFEFPYGLHG
jgi:hypothetical protein